MVARRSVSVNCDAERRTTLPRERTPAGFALRGLSLVRRGGRPEHQPLLAVWAAEVFLAQEAPLGDRSNGGHCQPGVPCRGRRRAAGRKQAEDASATLDQPPAFLFTRLVCGDTLRVYRELDTGFAMRAAHASAEQPLPPYELAKR